MPDHAAPYSNALLWEQLTADTVEVSATGRIIDYLDPTTTRLDRPEERVRQAYARILVDEYQYPKDCLRFEVTVNIGREQKIPDIAVFRSAAARIAGDQGQIRLVVETKAPTQEDGKRQLASYIFGTSAEGGVWTNGGSVAYFRRIDTPHVALVDWTNIPRNGETWDTVGHYRKTDLRPPRDLKRVFKRCHNAIYRSGLDSEDIALDMVRIILAKYRDEQNPGELCDFRCSPDEFSSPAGRLTVANRVRHLFQQVVADHPDVFQPNEQITIGEDGLSIVVNELQPFRFLADHETEQVYDVIGTAFEVYVAAHLKGSRGQYFTNRLVVNLMVEALNPGERDIVFDPACGSGGFLIAALRHIRNKILHSARSEAAKSREIRALAQHLFGVDISGKLVRVAKTNMVLNGDGHGGITQGNSLRDLRELPGDYPFNPSAHRRPNIVLTNPPFGASHELREKNPEVLTQFSLGHVWEPGPERWMVQTPALNESEGVPPETLFLERCVELLPPRGKLGIVIARGLLDNREAIPARQYLFRKTRLLGVINCHPNTFAPFNGTKASVIIVEKKAAAVFASIEDYPVFMAISQKIGQDSQGREIFKRDANGQWLIVNGQKVLDHDISEIVTAWHRFRRGDSTGYDAAWTVSLARIIAEPDMRLNPVRYAPRAERAVAQVLEMADTSDWTVERLGDFANVFNGPRFKRPFAEEGVTSGPGIVRMYTPKAFFEERGESAKYLDSDRATRTQQRAIDVLTLHRDYILIVDSGTAGKLLGKVGMTTSVHEGAVGNNNMIRVLIDSPTRRDYVYQFLRSDLGQTLLLRNVYGTNQDHVEPDDVKDIPIPIPRDENRLSELSAQVRQIVSLREQAVALDNTVNLQLDNLFRRSVEYESPQVLDETA